MTENLISTRWSLFLLCILHAGIGAAVDLVDFGSSAGSTEYGLAGWSTLLMSGNLVFTSTGGGGLRADSDPGEYGDFREVQGAPRKFSRGERIVVTWYNDSDESFPFASRISFTDGDEPDRDDPDGRWFTMRSFDDYRSVYPEIQPHAAAKTVFNIESTGVHRTDSTWSLVNINLWIDDQSSYLKEFLVCDRIELQGDADLAPPGAPAGLAATVLSDSKIRLVWTESADNEAVVEYLIYLGDGIEGYSQSNGYTCVFLEPGHEYSFSVSALDAAGNESARSEPVLAVTASFNGAKDLIQPFGFGYLGAFAMPETYNYGGEAIAFRPDGDGGEMGSLFVTNLNQQNYGWVGEVALAAPVVSQSKSIEELNVCAELAAAVNIRPGNVETGWDFVDNWRTGLAVIPEEGRLYSAWSIHYTVKYGEKHASISCCDASDLSGGGKYGAWYVGEQDEPPFDSMNNDWLFTAPRTWADAHCSGRNLVAGRCRDGGLSGLGPTLYAFAVVGSPPPPENSVFDFTTLLQYGPVEASDNVHFPDAVDGYNHADEWRDALWISAGDQDAVAVIGNKALGQNWYGYYGERMRNDWVGGDIPWPEFCETDPDCNKGWRSHNRQPMMIFYDPDDLSAVASGAKASWEPQPYAALRIPADLFYGSAHELFSAAFDSENGILYATEFVRELEGRLVMHAWKVNSAATAVHFQEAIPSGFEWFQNHPNPFNPRTEIRFLLHEPCRVHIQVFDLAGREIAVPADGWFQAGMHELHFDASGLSSGLYFYRIAAGEKVGTAKMVKIE